MLKDKPQRRALTREFEAGDHLGQLETCNEYEQRSEALPAEEKEITELCACFADICRYFSDNKMDIPPSVLDLIEGLLGCGVRDRIRILKDARQRLMEYLNDVGKGPKIQH